jgi:hypothetical protein
MNTTKFELISNRPAPIKWTIAKSLITEYLQKHPKPVAIGSSVLLESFIISKTEFGLVRQSWSNSNIDRIHLGFGYYNSEPSPGVGSGYTIVAFGLEKSNNALITSNDLAYDVKTKITNAQLALNSLVTYRANLKSQEQFNSASGGLQSGFNIELDEVDTLLEATEVHKIELILAYHKNSTPHPSTGFIIPAGYTIVILGLDRDNNRLTQGTNIFNYCHPCPTACPNNM